MKKLKVKREMVRALSNIELSVAQGGVAVQPNISGPVCGITIICPTARC